MTGVTLWNKSFEINLKMFTTTSTYRRDGYTTDDEQVYPGVDSWKEMMGAHVKKAVYVLDVCFYKIKLLMTWKG